MVWQQILLTFQYLSEARATTDLINPHHLKMDLPEGDLDALSDVMTALFNM